MINECDAPFCSNPPHNKLVAVSSPACIFRNRERYRLQGDNAAFDLRAKSDRLRTLDRQTRLCTDAIAGAAGIPTRLLYGSLQLDMQDTAAEHLSLEHTRYLKKTTAAVLQHDDENFIVHAAGRCMDELIMRHTDSLWCVNGPLQNEGYYSDVGEACDDAGVGEGGRDRDAWWSYSWRPGRLAEDQEAGFTLPISAGCPIINVEAVGSAAAASTSAQLLVRTTNEVFALKTTSLVESFTDQATGKLRHRRSKSKASLQLPLASLGTLLEPVQKWRLPEPIADMCVSPATCPYAGATFVGESGRMWRWCPTLGLYSPSSQPMIPPELLGLKTAPHREAPPASPGVFGAATTSAPPEDAPLAMNQSGTAASDAEVDVIAGADDDIGDDDGGNTGDDDGEGDGDGDGDMGGATPKGKAKKVNKKEFRVHKNLYRNQKRAGMTSVRYEHGLPASHQHPVRLRLESTVHPQVHLLAAREQLLQLDWRSPGTARRCFSASTELCAVQQLLHHPHNFVVSTAGASVLLLDDRYMAQAVARRVLLAHHDELLATAVTCNQGQFIHLKD